MNIMIRLLQQDEAGHVVDGPGHNAQGRIGPIQ